MGNFPWRSATDPGDLEMQERVKMVFNFTDSEVSRIIVTFNKLDRDNSRRVSAAELFELPYFKFNPFKKRIAEIFDKDLSGSLDIKEFAEVYSVFSVRASREQKLRFAYQVSLNDTATSTSLNCLSKIYDQDADGKISREDLEKTLRSVVGDHLEDEDIHQVIDHVFTECCGPGETHISFDGFSKAVMDTDIEGKLTIEF